MSPAQDVLTRLGNEVREGFSKNRRVMSFAEYLDLVASAPRRHLRSSPQYLADCFHHYGTEEVAYPAGPIRRFKLFDCPWADGRERLIGQEEVQNQVYRVLANFVHEGASNRLILLHGPNGSAKSTLVRCIGRALQHYSTLDRGALYRLNWIFPTGKLHKGDIGFGGERKSANHGASHAYLPSDLIDAKLTDELRDHPMLLIPIERRQALIDQMLADARGDAADDTAGDTTDSFVLSDYLRFGQLSHKNRAIYEALLSSFQGDYLEVLRHVQVERFFIQHRYREGYVTVEPHLSVDANERQVTADRSVSALPVALQSVSLFEYGGEVVNANRGLIEYSDLFKRPLEAYKYLLTTVEGASIHMQSATLYLDLVFVGTSNDVHLDAFKKSAEFLSFQGRLALVRVPYLREFDREQAIYQDRIEEAAGSRHVAPHCAYVAALWAVLTRMRKPTDEGVPENLQSVVTGLDPLEKAELYTLGQAPERLDPVVARELVALSAALRAQGAEELDYEGRVGASPREMLGVIFNAANATGYSYVSPLAILDELRELSQKTSVHRFLELPTQEGGYRDPRSFIDICRHKLIDAIEEDVLAALGLVDESEYARLFERYITHVIHWTKGEKLTNPVSRQAEEPDEAMMRGVEDVLGAKGGDRDAFRRDLISRIGAWALDHPNQKPEYKQIFGEHFKRLAADYFERRKKNVSRGLEIALSLLTDNTSNLDADEVSEARATVDRMIERFQYDDDSARDAISLLFRTRYQ